jgi:hypothetical protein
VLLSSGYPREYLEERGPELRGPVEMAQKPMGAEERIERVSGILRQIDESPCRSREAPGNRHGSPKGLDLRDP